MDATGQYYVPGYIVAPGCDEEMAEDRFYTCPLAEVTRPGSPVRQIIESHRLLEVEGIRLVDLHPNPTPALISALGELDIVVASYRREKERRALEDMKRQVKHG